MHNTLSTTIRRRNRRNANGSFGLGTTTPSYAWDFVNNKARFNSINYGVLANTPGWSFTRASTGYAQTAAGVLVPFASGELRRTDKGALIEGARTNLCLQSQTFSNASWTKTNATVTAAQTIGPDGLLSGWTLQQTGGGGTMTQAMVATATTHTWYAIVKLGVVASNLITILLRNTTTATNLVSASYNLATGATPGMIAIGNGWYICPVTASTGITIGDTLTGYCYGGNSSGTGDYVYVWHCQLENGAFQSSPIPTTTASATRAADVLTVPVSGIDYPLSAFVEFERGVDTVGTEPLMTISAGNNNDRAAAELNSTDAFRGLIVTGGATEANASVGAATVGPVYRGAFRCAANDFRSALAGALSAPDVAVNVPAAPTTVNFGTTASGSTPSFGYLRRAAIWNRALSDAELQTVTR